MLRFLLVSAALVTVLAAPITIAANPPWTPDAQVIAQLESQMRLPTNPLSAYARYYSGAISSDDHRTIKALLVKPKHDGDKPPGIYVVDESQLPYTHEGTCDVIHIDYVVDAIGVLAGSQIIKTACGGGPP